ncbi:hypothetical protein N0V90_012449 [Kalmusia sp. IMI 367209]|nr:hypothetical protein N0V90_012449 [Kalmusia sp. IMI 367209]
MAPTKCLGPAPAFPLLCLPKELRLMVYERLPISRFKVQVNLTGVTAMHDDVDEKFDVIIYGKTVPVAILATCRQASPFVDRLKAEILELPPHIDLQWDRPEFLHNFYNRFLPLGPDLTSDLVRHKTHEYFPHVDTATRQVIVQLIQRATKYRSGMVNQKRPIVSLRIVDILFGQAHEVLSSMSQAFFLLLENICWNEKRERMLFNGEKDPGEATHERTPDYIYIKCDGDLNMLGVHRVVDGPGLPDIYDDPANVL